MLITCDDREIVLVVPVLETFRDETKTMNTIILALHWCLGGGGACLAVWGCGLARAVGAQAPIGQTAVTNQNPVRLCPTDCQRLPL